MSYADIAASGPKQTVGEAAAPQPAEIQPTESASTASLVDVDMPSVHTVNSDFLDQPVQTETQAARLDREEEESRAEEKRKRDAAAAAKAKACKADSWLTRQFSQLSDSEAGGVAIANLVGIVSLSAYLGYKGWGLYERGRLDWKAVGVGAGILAGVSAVQGVVGRYLYKGQKKGGS